VAGGTSDKSNSLESAPSGAIPPSGWNLKETYLLMRKNLQNKVKE
jgi:hypothetical protein